MGIKKLFWICFALLLFQSMASGSLFYPDTTILINRTSGITDINGGSYWFRYLAVDHLDANTMHVTDLNIIDYNVAGDGNFAGSISVLGNSFLSNVNMAKDLNAATIRATGDSNFSKNLQIDGNLYATKAFFSLKPAENTSYDYPFRIDGSTNPTNITGINQTGLVTFGAKFTGAINTSTANYTSYNFSTGADINWNGPANKSVTIKGATMSNYFDGNYIQSSGAGSSSINVYGISFDGRASSDANITRIGTGNGSMVFTAYGGDFSVSNNAYWDQADGRTLTANFIGGQFSAGSIGSNPAAKGTMTWNEYGGKFIAKPAPPVAKWDSNVTINNYAGDFLAADGNNNTGINIQAISTAQYGTNIGIKIGAISGGATNWTIYSAGLARSYFGGDFNILGDLNVMGSLALGVNTDDNLFAGDINARAIHYDVLIPKSPHLFEADPTVGYTRFCIKDSEGYYDLIYWTAGKQIIETNSKTCSDKVENIETERARVTNAITEQTKQFVEMNACKQQFGMDWLNNKCVYSEEKAITDCQNDLTKSWTGTECVNASTLTS